MHQPRSSAAKSMAKTQPVTCAGPGMVARTPRRGVRPSRPDQTCTALAGQLASDTRSGRVAKASHPGTVPHAGGTATSPPRRPRLSMPLPMRRRPHHLDRARAAAKPRCPLPPRPQLRAMRAVPAGSTGCTGPQPSGAHHELRTVNQGPGVRIVAHGHALAGLGSLGRRGRVSVAESVLHGAPWRLATVEPHG